MAYVTLSSKAVGSTIKLKVNGSARNFIVVHQGKPSSVYDDSCNGTWLLMQEIYESRAWNSSNTNDYAKSTIHSYLNSTFLNLFESNIKNAIKQVKIPYRKGHGTSKTVTSGLNGLSAKIFLLSATETSFSFSYMPSGEGAELAYFKGCADNSYDSDSKRVAYLNGSAASWRLRSPGCNIGSGRALSVSSDGGCGDSSCSTSSGIRPALILPSTLLVSDDGTVSTNTAPSTPGSISVPSSIMGGTNISISWEKSSDAESNLAGYKVERSTNGGSSWSQIYQGTATSTTNNVAFGTASVMYRVKAYDDEGLESGWRTSSQVTVVNNNAPSAPPSIAVPNDVKGGSTLVISWTAASDSDGNLSGYILERSTDGSSAYTQVYKGNALTYTDTITKGWSTVMYRVKAYDSYDAQSGYTTSTKRTVDNNTAPTITTSSAANLGTKSSGFTVSYSVDDVDAGDTLTVTEKLDGTTKRTYTATRKTTNSFAVTGEYFQKITNGSHTMTVTVTDGKATVTKAFTFTKAVTAANITLAQPMEADAQITLCAITVGGLIPADAVFKVEVTNNGKDSSPVWEDATTEARNGRNHLFTNQTAANGFAFNFRVTAERGASGESGYIASIQGGFQ
nr:MAG TPA: FN3 [Bacteriophage sp.]